MNPSGGTLWWLPRLLDDESLDATETLLMVALAEHVSVDSDECWPSIKRLAQRARCSYATARRRLAALEERGRIERTTRRRGDGGRSTDLYTLLRDPLLNLSSAPLHEREQSPSAHQGERAEQTIGEPTIEEPSSSTALQPTLALVIDDEHESIAFERLWERYPKRNGKRVGRKQAEQQWARLKHEQRGAALRAVEHYADACARGLTIAKDAHRWLRDHAFDDWQERAVADAPRAGGKRVRQHAVNDGWTDDGGWAQ